MVKIIPFKGITYNPDKINTMDDVMSPPYDIISKKMQHELYDKHPHNFVRLILGKQSDEDTDADNRYTRAKKHYEEWLQTAILEYSDKPSIYPYVISYELEGEHKEMHGFFTLLKLDKEYKLVKAHERTLSKPKADRLNLMKACRSNLEPIQLLYIDENNDIQNMIDENINSSPLIEVTGYDQFTHKLWKLSDESIISKIQKHLDDEILFIADGHHRYQTAINYADEQQKENKDSSDESPYNYRMVILVNMYDKGLAILPTHRLINLPEIKEEKIITSIKPYFSVETYPVDKAKDISTLVEEIKEHIKDDSQHKFALYFKEQYYILTLTDLDIMNEIAKERSDVWRTLDVSILHKIIIEKILGITQENLEDHIKYTREDSEAISFVQEGEYDCSVIMNATRIDELKAIADGGEHMPQKSTYFLPKMLSGLVMYNMDNS